MSVEKSERNKKIYFKYRKEMRLSYGLIAKKVSKEEKKTIGKQTIYDICKREEKRDVDKSRNEAI